VREGDRKNSSERKFTNYSSMGCKKINLFNFVATKVIVEGGGHLLLRRRRINEMRTLTNMLTL
jgi:hypothetical protein